MMAKSSILEIGCQKDSFQAVKQGLYVAQNFSHKNLKQQQTYATERKMNKSKNVLSSIEHHYLGWANSQYQNHG